jgi:hypothetical protein
MKMLKHIMFFATIANVAGCVRVPFCDVFDYFDQCVVEDSSIGEDSGTSESGGVSDDGVMPDEIGALEDSPDDGDIPDMDMDGVDDHSDNCPEASNPNQLDYDGNEIGNVCDTQVLASVTGNLNTTMFVDAGIAGMCEIPLTLEVMSGQIMVQLDDDAAVAAFEISNLQIADLGDKPCMLAVALNVSLNNFMIENSGGPFPVSMPHSLAMHDAGQIAGMPDAAHPVLSVTTMLLLVDVSPSEFELMIDGELPIFTANIVSGGASGTLSFADTQFVLGTGQVMLEVPIPITVDFALTGLVGTLSLAPDVFEPGLQPNAIDPSDKR